MSETPRTDAVENETLAEYRYCERAFNEMADHARALERELRALTIVPPGAPLVEGTSK